MPDDPKPAGHNELAAMIPLLLIMTAVTGIVDAVSILQLGHVFVANMTGNVVFLGFALAGASGFSVAASLAALGAFLVGAAIGARVPAKANMQALRRIAAAEAALCAAATITASAGTGAGARYAMTALLALAMGGQNATVRKLAVPDMTTTVLTLTLTGLVGDAPDVGRPESHTARRLGAVISMIGGATAGAVIVLNCSTGWALGAATALLAALALAARPASKSSAHTESSE